MENLFGMKVILLKPVQLPMLLLILLKFIMAAKEGKIHVLEFNASSEYTLDKRRVISINGYNATFGPEIRVKSGDTLNLKLTNWICSEEEASKDSDVWKDYCSTALHFHGVVPLANEFDGIPGLTQPTIGYGESYWYNFTIDQSTCGTFWYHSHSSVQYGDGMRGVLIIECDDYDNHVANTINSVRDIETLDDGVVTMKKDKRTKELTDYEVQEKIITLSDWYTNWNLDILNDKVLSSTGGTDPKFDGSLINGKPSDGEAIKIGFNTKYLLLRIVNSGMSGTQVFHLDGFQLIVLEADGIMIKPFIVQTINLAVGQRYTILVKLKSDTSFVRMINGCNKMMGYITKQRWFYKEGAHLDLPKNPNDVSIEHLPGFTKAELYRVIEPTQEENKRLRTKADPVAVFEFDYAYYKDESTKQKYGTGMYKVNERTFSEYVKDPVRFGFNETYDIVINSLDHMRHPWHMHGHHFQIISLGNKGDGPFHKDVQEGKAWSRYQNDLRHLARTGKAPMVRDSINIAGNSYAVLRINTEMPGKWLLHCHVEWHMMKGLGIVFEVPTTTEDSTKQATTAVLSYPTKEPDLNTVVHPAALEQNKSKVIAVYILIMCAVDAIFYWLLM